MAMTLSSRVEAASGPDRGLDADIYCALYPEWKWDRSVQNPTGWVSAVSGRGVMAPSPGYTASIDAAVTVIPEGANWLLGHGKTRPTEPWYGAQIFDLDDKVIGAAENDATPALALLAAALKARGL